MSGAAEAEVPRARAAALTPFSALVGSTVTGPDGAKVGTIADIMVAAAEGRVVYVALSVGGFYGVGERLFAVPWEAFIVDPVAEALSLHFDAGALDGKPGFDKDAWPTAADATLVSGN